MSLDHPRIHAASVLARVEAILTARHRKDQMEGDGAVGCFDAAAAAEELHAAGLLAPEPQIILTKAARGGS